MEFKYFDSHQLSTKTVYIYKRLKTFRAVTLNHDTYFWTNEVFSKKATTLEMVEFNKVFLNKKVRHKITGNIGYIKSCQPNHSENYYFGVYWEFFNHKTTNYYWNDIFYLEFIDDE